MSSNFRKSFPGPPRGPMSNRASDAQFLGICREAVVFPPITCASGGVVVSLDGIRCKWIYPEYIMDASGSLVEPCLDLYKRLADPSNILLSVTFAKRPYRIGSYAYCVTLRDSESHSLTVLIGRYGPEKREPLPEAVLDVNPSKTDSKLVAFVVREMSLHARLKPVVARYDLAIDLPISRDKCYLMPEAGRHYCKIIGANGAVTEYIGRRQHHGYVKLYDKSAEAGLDRDLTRLEITLDSLRDIPDVIPNVVVYDGAYLSDDPILVQCMIAHPDLIPLVKSSVSRNTWSKCKKYLTERNVVGWSFEPELYVRVNIMVKRFFDWLNIIGLF